MIVRVVFAALALATIGAAPAPDITVPTTIELKTYKIKSFAYAAGRTAPLKLGYRTLGNPHKGADGQIDNAVVLLHGTGGSGAAFLGAKAPLLFGPGAPLDLARNYIILPDSIGIGGSSKPSDGLGVNFPHYTYPDIVRATRALVHDELKVARLRVVVGVSMGAMLGWTWATEFPQDIGTLIAMGGWPQQVSGRNLLWRLSARDALLVSPLPGGSGARIATGITMMANVPAPLLTRLIPDANSARDAIDARLATAPDSIDLAFQLDSVRAYDPTAKLGAITATVVALNFADDPLYPPETDPLPALAKRYPKITSITVPTSAKTMGHATLGEPAVWLPYVEAAIRAAR